MTSSRFFPWEAGDFKSPRKDVLSGNLRKLYEGTGEGAA
jgi:hypothetical protein